MIRKIYKNIKYFRLRKSDSIKVWLVNFGEFNEHNYQDNWIVRFIKMLYGKDIVYSPFKADFVIGSVFGDKNKFINHKGKVKIFFTGEDVSIDKSEYSQYNNYCIKDVDISIGYDYRDEDNYIRIPLWLLYFFEPQFQKDDVYKRVIGFNKRRFDKTEYCTLVARHDRNGIRTEIFTELNKISKVKAAGDLNHNDNDLREQYNDDKLKYLEKFKFNICPENSLVHGYVTEKIFQSFWSGAIPVYWGNPDPEPGILNKDAFIFWEKNESNSSIIEKIKLLNSDKNAYQEFINKPRLLDTATDEIWKMYVKLKESVKSIFTE